MSAATPPLDHVLALATRLPPADTLRLIERLAPQIVAAVTSVSAVPATVPDGLARYRAFVADFQATYPDVDPAAQLAADRHARDTALRDTAPDVHP